ncbi:TonB C-terminal domain-containing protein, partial [Candidatus Dependentiae bacterium]
LRLQYEIENEIAKHWRPPAGLSKDLYCTINVLVDWNGNVKQSMVKRSSGVLIFDISARMAVAKLSLPKNVRGKEINITFNQ